MLILAIQSHLIMLKRLNTIGIHDKEAGLDFALIGLGAYYRLLQANGIVAVSHENWEKQHEVDFGKHMIIVFHNKQLRLPLGEVKAKKYI
ncbi:MAG: hypothetical protein U0Z26_04465 [Anaerolineales bacterium]